MANWEQTVRHKSKTTQLLKKPKKLPINLLRRKQRKAMWKQQRKRHARWKWKPRNTLWVMMNTKTMSGYWIRFWKTSICPNINKSLSVVGTMKVKIAPIYWKEYSKIKINLHTLKACFGEISIRKNRRSPGLNRQTSARCSTLCPNWKTWK